jgi:hypothetical protein
VKVIQAPTTITTERFELYKKLRNFDTQISKANLSADEVCVLMESKDLVEITNQSGRAFSIVLFDEFRPEIGQIVSQRNQVVVASQRAIDLFGGYIDSRKTMNLEIWLRS